MLWQMADIIEVMEHRAASFPKLIKNPQSKIPEKWGWPDCKARDLGLSDLGPRLIQSFQLKPRTDPEIWA